MIYKSSKDWLQAKSKRVMLFGMSGVGKTHISNILRNTGNWYHYSVDYRIGTRYMGEHIVDNFKLEAMKNPFLANLLKSDSIYICSNISFNNLDPLSTFLGKLGSGKMGGLSLEEYSRRQNIHRRAEINSLEDSEHFIERAKMIYGYNHFVCDTGGSICEVIDPFDPDDSLMEFLSDLMLPVFIEPTEGWKEKLLRRFIDSPKPMYYRPDFLAKQVEGLDIEALDPDEFSRSMYQDLVEERLPRYESMARNWGIKVSVEDLAEVSNVEQFEILIAKRL